MRNTSSPLEGAVGALRRSQIVCYPTDTLWGLGVSAFDARAVRTLFLVKERPTGFPVSILFSSSEEVEPYAELDDRSRRALRRYLPGPFTFILKATSRARREFAPTLLSHKGTLGVRVPDHPVARELARQAGPITTTSANVHGLAPVQSVDGARRLFGGRVSAYLDAGPAPSGAPSVLIDLSGRTARYITR